MQATAIITLLLLATSFADIPGRNKMHQKYQPFKFFNGTLKHDISNKVEDYDLSSCLGRNNCFKDDDTVDGECMNQCISSLCEGESDVSDCTNTLKKCVQTCDADDDDDRYDCYEECEWMSAEELYEDTQCDIFDDEEAYEYAKEMFADFPDMMNMLSTACKCMKGKKTYLDAYGCLDSAMSSYVCIKAVPFFSNAQHKTQQQQHHHHQYHINQDDEIGIPYMVGCRGGSKTITGEKYNSSCMGVMIDDAKVNIVSCSFTDMQSGAVSMYSIKGSLGISKCDFTKCVPSYYSSVIDSYGLTVITYCKFDSCKAPSGAIISLTTPYDSSISNTNFTNCGVYGGDGNTVVNVYAMAKVTIASCYFSNTEAQQAPASLYVKLSSTDSVTVDSRVNKMRMHHQHRMNADDKEVTYGSLVLKNTAFENVKINGVENPTEQGADAKIEVSSSIETPSITITAVSSTQPTQYSLLSNDEVPSSGVTQDDDPYKNADAGTDAGISLPEVQSAPKNKDDNGFPAWAVVLIVVVVILVIAIVVMIIVFFVVRKKKENESSSAKDSAEEGENEI